MAKLIKKRKNKFKAFSGFLFKFSVVVYIFTMVFVKAGNATLQNQVTELESQIKVQSEKNQAMRLDIEKTCNRANLVAIADEEGLSYIEQNVVAIKD